MDVLIRKSDSTIVNMWPSGVVGRVPHPEKPGGALSTNPGASRPVDFGDYTLVQATVSNADYDEDFQTRAGPAYSVAGDFSTTAAYTVSYKSLADCKEVKLAELATFRYEQEVGGITVATMPVATDWNTQSKAHAARTKAKENALYTVEWKTESGFSTLNAATIIILADAIQDHVQDCFDNEKTHTTAINALTTAAEVDAYDITTGW